MNDELYNTQAYFDLTGKSALIIGATGALGRVAAKALARAGASVTLTGGNREILSEIEGSIQQDGCNVFSINLRPDNEENAATIVQKAAEQFGGLDILVVASGFNKPGTAFETTLTDFDGIQDANVRQTWLICRETGRVMIEQNRGGKMVIISSVRGQVAASNATAYCSSKAATDMLTKCFAVEYGPSGINVNAIAPTVFRSPLTSWLFEEEGPGAEMRESVVKRIPLGRLGEPEDYIGSIVFCSSRASDFMTGHTLMVDGGFVIT